MRNAPNIECLGQQNSMRYFRTKIMSGSDSSDVSIEPGETPPEALYEHTVNDDDDQFSSDMDVPDKTPDGISQPLTSDFSSSQHDHPSDTGMPILHECV